MSAPKSTRTQKDINISKRPMKIEMRSTILKSTESSRAKQATAKIKPKASGTGDIPQKRYPFKSKIPIIERCAVGNPTGTPNMETGKNSFATEAAETRNAKNVKTMNSRITGPARKALTTKEENVRSRLSHRNNLSSSKRSCNQSEDIANNQDIESTLPKDMGVQTNEKEILNNSLIVGDVKYLNPSPNVVKDIEKQSKHLKTKIPVHNSRKFGSERGEEHIDDLNEFLHKSYVTKKIRKPRNRAEEEKKLFASMDQLINRELPLTISLTDVKTKIQHKEKELLSLFENFQNNSR